MRNALREVNLRANQSRTAATAMGTRYRGRYKK